MQMENKHPFTQTVNVPQHILDKVNAANPDKPKMTELRLVFEPGTEVTDELIEKGAMSFHDWTKNAKLVSGVD